MSGWPIRLRLTAAFALAMLVVLAAAAVLVYFGVREELDDSVASSLRARADAVAAGAGTSGQALGAGGEFVEAEEGFAQVLSRSGRLLAAGGGARAPVLDAGQLERAAAHPVTFDADVDGIEGTARVTARAVSTAPGAPIVAVGQSLEDRDETLTGLLTTFAIGGPVAVAVASLVGYLLASAGLAPVEAMRRRAAEISLSRDESLPLPAADDEVRRLGTTLNEMLARLRDSYERERRFVADASHELRTPLAVLKAELETALESGSQDPDLRESLRVALEECDHLVQLADDLLILARAGDGELALRPERVEARTLLEGARDRFVHRAEQRDRRITVRAPVGLAVVADPVRIRQALGNLVDNALRHGAGDVALTARQAGEDVELAVADAGRGFSADLAATAFERFTRGDAARAGRGAGLGLAIVRSIVRAHGGDAEIRSGTPAVVRIRLRAASPQSNA